MPLTDTAIKAAKPGEKTYKLSDGGGLQLWVAPSGSKYWRLAYRRPADKKPDTLAFGVYPATTLAEARKKREAAKELLRQGLDPKAHKRAEQARNAEQSLNTFDAVADELLDKKRREGRSKATLVNFTWLLSLARPMLGKRPIAELAHSPSEILACLKTIERRGRNESALRVCAAIGQVLRLAAASGRCDADPTTLLRGALAGATVRHRPAIEDPAAFGELLRAIQGYNGAPETRICLQLLALTFVRPSELTKAAWSEIDFEARVWTVPAARTKMRRDHRVPISRQALRLLEQLREFTGDTGFLFPSLWFRGTTMSESTLGYALKSLGYSGEQHTPHGFRSSASTMLNESGKWTPDAIERQLAHKGHDKIRAIYNRADHWPERVAMMQWWADSCDDLARQLRVA